MRRNLAVAAFSMLLDVSLSGMILSHPCSAKGGFQNLVIVSFEHGDVRTMRSRVRGDNHVRLDLDHPQPFAMKV